MALKYTIVTSLVVFLTPVWLLGTRLHHVENMPVVKRSQCAHDFDFDIEISSDFRDSQSCATCGDGTSVRFRLLASAKNSRDSSSWGATITSSVLYLEAYASNDGEVCGKVKIKTRIN